MLLHATCVAWNGQGVLITGEPGTGKSSLALSCIDAGATLVADDQTVIRQEGGMLLASAPETIAGALAIRSVGVFRMPHVPHASLLFQLELESDAPGWSETPLETIRLPQLALPKGFRPNVALVRHLLLSHDGTRPDVWLHAEDWLPEKQAAGKS